MAIALALLIALFSRYRFALIPVMLLGGAVIWTALPSDTQNRFRTVWVAGLDEEADRNWDARLQHFYAGMDNWSNYPLTGVGPGMHGMRGAAQQAHNLPGQVAGELGTLGIIAFLFMLSCFFINHYNIWRNYKYLQEKKLGEEGRYCWWLSIGVMCAIAMVLVQGTGLHNSYRFPWVWFGAFHVLAAMIMQEKVLDAMKGKLRPGLTKMSAEGR
jgi:O-antigen ligase